MLQRVRVLIMGGGIGGCSLWLALRRESERSLAKGRGPLFNATIFEQAKQIQPVGAGITLGPNGLRVLDSLGLLDRLKGFGGEVSKLHVYTEKGELLRIFDCAYMWKRYGYPLLCMERAELQALLVHQVLRSEASFPGPKEDANAISFGKRCVRVHDLGPTGGGVVAQFEDGTEEAGDVVVGADGARSAVRAALYGPKLTPSGEQQAEDKEGSIRPRYAGIASLLGVTSSVPDSVQGNAFWVLGKGRIYGTWSMGRRKQYWFLTRREELVSTSGGAQRDDVLEEGRWTPADALKGMDEMWNWYHPYDAHAMFSRTVRAVKVGFFELPRGQKPPLAGPHVRDSGSRVAILGDAAHSMLPTVHQGANLAIEDAATFAQALASRCAPLEGTAAVRDCGGGNEALDLSIRLAVRDYVGLRSARVQRAVDMSRLTGLWQTSDSAAVEFIRSTAIRWIPDPLVHSSLDWIYNYRIPVVPGLHPSSG